MEKLPALDPAQLRPWLDREAMVHACVAQVMKDLGPYGIHLTYSGQAATAYEELFGALQPQLFALLGSKATLHEILYRVDVNENQLARLREGNEETASTLTRLILWRELQKVVTRFMLSQEG